jgi:hypothetical protein
VIGRGLLGLSSVDSELRRRRHFDCGVCEISTYQLLPRTVYHRNELKPVSSASSRKSSALHVSLPCPPILAADSAPPSFQKLWQSTHFSYSHGERCREHALYQSVEKVCKAEDTVPFRIPLGARRRTIHSTRLDSSDSTLNHSTMISPLLNCFFCTQSTGSADSGPQS